MPNTKIKLHENFIHSLKQIVQMCNSKDCEKVLIMKDENSHPSIQFQIGGSGQVPVQGKEHEERTEDCDICNKEN